MWNYYSVRVPDGVVSIERHKQFREPQKSGHPLRRPPKLAIGGSHYLVPAELTMPQPIVLNISGLDVQVTASALEASAFAPFGAVIENPRPGLHPASFVAGLPFDAVSANQGFAIKYQHVTRMVNLYDQAPSRKPGAAVMNMFVCAARRLDPPGAFRVLILERHPFTTQTFIPLSKEPGMRYLVIVAPSLPPGKVDEGLPVPSAVNDGPPAAPAPRSLPGRGLPDLTKLRAFIATAEQAVTYGAGTWHAPMVALGPEDTAMDFVVVQFANGVAIEDCQEVVFSCAEDARRMPMPDGGVVVKIPGTTRVARL